MTGSELLLLDVGGSNWRAELIAAGVVKSAQSKAFPPIAHGEVSPERLRSGLETVWESLGETGSTPSLVAMAATGIIRIPAHMDGVHGELRRWQTVSDTLAVSDAAAGLAGALGELGEGCLLSVGTGVAAVARTSEAGWMFKDGWGPLLGDEGGGYWLGARGLRAALRHRDGRSGGSPALATMAVEQFGEEPESWPLRGDLEDAVQQIATFSTAMATAAEGGDEVASRIIKEACSLLLDTARSISTGREVHLGGGVVESSFIRNSLMELADDAGLTFVDSRGDALSGLRLIERHGPETFMTWVGDMGEWRRWEAGWKSNPWDA